MRALLTQLASKTGEPDASGARPFRPASIAQLAALEQRWGRPLPPSLHDALSLHDGDFRLCRDLTLLSVDDMLADRFELRTRHARAGALSDAIFARGEDPRHVLAFDFSRLDDGHEPLVVRVIDGHADLCWPSLLHLVHDLLGARNEGPSGPPGATTYDLWTNCGVYWLANSALNSRGFDPSTGVRFLQESNRVFTRLEDIAPDPFLSAEQLAEIDQRFTSAVATLDRRSASWALVVTSDGPAFEAAQELYVWYEPGALLVIALAPRSGEVELITDPKLDGRQFSPDHDALVRQLRALLAQRRLVDALALSIEWATAQLRRYLDALSTGPASAL